MVSIKESLEIINVMAEESFKMSKENSIKDNGKMDNATVMASGPTIKEIAIADSGSKEKEVAKESTLPKVPSILFRKSL